MNRIELRKYVYLQLPSYDYTQSIKTKIYEKKFYFLTRYNPLSKIEKNNKLATWAKYRYRL